MKQDHLDPARRIVAAFGKGDIAAGVASVALITGRNPSTVYRWMYPDGYGTGGFIPTREANALVLAASRFGIRLKHKDFFVID